MQKLVMLSFVCLLMLLVACSDDEETEHVGDKIAGTWNGAIEVPDSPLNIVIEFASEDELDGNISIPIQNLDEFPLSNLTFDGESVYFEMEIPEQQIDFEGELVNEDRIEGTFTQQGQSFSFYLDRGQLAGQVGDRTEEENFLTVETEHGKLKGELLEPEGEGPYPVVLIIPGSGPTDRDGNSISTLPGKNNSLKMLAEGLAENGIASLRYSKRGAGENSEAVIPEEEIRFDDFINDANSWLQMLKQDERFLNVGVIGHSQGALIGALAIQESGADAFVSLAGAGQSVDHVLKDQLQGNLNEEDYNEAVEILTSLKQGNTVDDINPNLEGLFSQSIQPFLISWMQYNPRVVYSKLNLPILIVQGNQDLQISPENAEMLLEATPQAEQLILEDMSHVLKDASEDSASNMETYTNPDLPLSEGLIEGVVEFLKEDF
ncbi:alpha/beta hydrolase [Aquisalibacillus elongatus]|uniref:Serine aminopeptidase S33 domain-containing protein n=1 Tax=Aquisalibacillus elongatus TaxID=485577 RepID=A0A3N5C550_9BACI|nr:alpha/beta hydrolase [Aquisalibacillus elongatus]RPF53285.1 hypothetical protein EDC24_1782 [Aquisalibacillus elongatus]